MQQNLFSQSREEKLEKLLIKAHRELIQNLPDDLGEDDSLTLLLREIESEVKVEVKVYVLPF